MIYFKNEKEKQGFNYYNRTRTLKEQEAECPFPTDSDNAKNWLNGLRFHHRLHEPYTI